MSTNILLVATLASGLMAGLFYAWSISVTPGLAKIDDEHYLQAFQKMNRAIINPLFIIPFFGLVLILPYLAYINFAAGEIKVFIFSSISTSLYLFGIMIITIFGNIPLNNSLESLDIKTMTREEMKNFRTGFEKKWNRLNTVRTISSFLSLLMLIIACLITIR